MNRGVKIILNILIFTLIIGFGYYMVHSIIPNEETTQSGQQGADPLYKKTNSIDAASPIVCFDIYDNTIYAALSGKISVFGITGSHLYDFVIEVDVRDIIVEDESIWLLYPTRIDVYALGGHKKGGWEACSNIADYCAFATTGEYVFVTDAENKEMVQYDKQGRLVRFIKSPQGFIIPSYSFGIVNINDTIYCSNSGRHQIESYTLDGVFVASFGVTGTQAGAFAGCCNPVYLTKSANGNILTSEKGNPRISCYGRNGKFRTILFDTHALGGVTDAYKVRALSDNIYIANKKTISVYTFDSNLLEKSCTGCQEKCSL